MRGSDNRQSQLRREQLSEALTQGIRQEGMMAYADPVFRSGESQAYAASYVPFPFPLLFLFLFLFRPEYQIWGGVGKKQILTDCS